MLKIEIDTDRYTVGEIKEFLIEVIEFFELTASNLPFEEVYAPVFPHHIRLDNDTCREILNTIKYKIEDNFYHYLKGIEEYVLYHILDFVWEGTEHTFETETLTIPTLIDIIFEDIDFLDIGRLVELYQKNPKIVTDFFNVDLEQYKEIMPPDILEIYVSVKQKPKQQRETLTIEDLIDATLQLLNKFQQLIRYKKWNTFIEVGQEKELQTLFLPIAEEHFKNLDVTVIPEGETGRGTVDFCITKGYRLRVFVEFKLSSHNSFQNGIKYQLITYLLAQECKYGIFVLFALDTQSLERETELIELAKEINKLYNKQIQVKVIDARKNLKSASKIKEFNDI
ncbi:hypothetical protein ACOQFO_13635 [Ureibacillus sp. MALMAid1270]|uniref:hypothetical protein n=1 Tax=Ureibacillus sp. MALMAid1270 TaxID=3411629 RepID=UPI003BA6A3E4